MDFSTRLKELRKAKKVSQTSLGKEIGVTLKQIQRYESGENEPTLSILLRLSDFFDVSVDYLTGKSDHPYVVAVFGLPPAFHEAIYTEMEKLGIPKDHAVKESKHGAVSGIDGIIVERLTPWQAKTISESVTKRVVSK